MSGLVKAKKYDWKDSNLALFGSDLERNVSKHLVTLWMKFTGKNPINSHNSSSMSIIMSTSSGETTVRKFPARCFHYVAVAINPTSNSGRLNYLLSLGEEGCCRNRRGMERCWKQSWITDMEDCEVQGTVIVCSLFCSDILNFLETSAL